MRVLCYDAVCITANAEPWAQGKDSRRVETALAEPGHVINCVEFGQLGLGLVEVLGKGTSERVWHHDFFLGTYPIRPVEDVVVLGLPLSLVNCCVERILEVLGQLLLVQFLFDSTDDRHDPADVFVEQVTFLQALICYHILSHFLPRDVLLNHDRVVGDVVYHMLLHSVDALVH